RDKPKRRWRTLGLIALALVGLPLLGAGSIEAWMQWAARGEIYRDLAAVPQRRVAIVFGAQVLPGERLSNALAYRVDAAIALYNAGKVETLLMTGDGRASNYDEPTAMRDYALARGVPEGAIVLDGAGLRTYDSCYRAHSIYGVRPDEAILVTQEYHLPRALYTCGNLDVRAIGFAARPFEGPRAVEAERREHPARWLAWWQVVVSRPVPASLH
ncbi:MAG: ElyC/SanA/YdcF family protein, partial [Thermomicrobiales bacterium]